MYYCRIKSYKENISGSHNSADVDVMKEWITSDKNIYESTLKPSDNGTLFEVIHSDRSIKMYLDIENIPVSNPTLIDEIIADLKQYIKEKEDKTIISHALTVNKGSRTHPGLSYHLYFPEMATTSANLQQFLMKYTKYDDYIDKSVYNHKRLFKMAYQQGIMKYNPNREFIQEIRSKYNDISDFYHLPKQIRINIRKIYKNHFGKTPKYGVINELIETYEDTVIPDTDPNTDIHTIVYGSITDTIIQDTSSCLYTLSQQEYQPVKVVRQFSGGMNQKLGNKIVKIIQDKLDAVFIPPTSAKITEDIDELVKKIEPKTDFQKKFIENIEQHKRDLTPAMIINFLNQWK